MSQKLEEAIAKKQEAEAKLQHAETVIRELEQGTGRTNGGLLVITFLFPRVASRAGLSQAARPDFEIFTRPVLEGSRLEPNGKFFLETRVKFVYELVRSCSINRHSSYKSIYSK